MSGIPDIIASKLDGQTTGQLDHQLGAELPILLGGLERNARSEAGANQPNDALGRDHDGSVLNDLTGFFGQRPMDRDDRLVDHGYVRCDG